MGVSFLSSVSIWLVVFLRWMIGWYGHWPGDGGSEACYEIRTAICFLRWQAGVYGGNKCCISPT
jgi:hypothetical protein